MPTHTQTIVETVPTEAAKGSTSTTTVQACFPASPIYTGEMTDDSVKAQYEELVLAGEVNDGGHTFGKFNRNYIDAPNIADVEWGGGGLPGSPYAPNPVSPGPGSMNASEQGEPPEGWAQKPPAQWGTGVGSQLQPSESSKQQSGGTLGDYALGKAWGTSS